jgi:hypothetical protein
MFLRNVTLLSNTTALHEWSFCQADTHKSAEWLFCCHILGPAPPYPIGALAAPFPFPRICSVVSLRGLMTLRVGDDPRAWVFTWDTLFLGACKYSNVRVSNLRQ